jgi:hypothetical protein
MFACKSCSKTYSYSVESCECGAELFVALNNIQPRSPEATINAMKIEIIHLNKAYKDLLRQADKITMLIDDKVLPTNVSVSTNTVVDELYMKVRELEESKEFFVQQGIKLRKENEDFIKKVALLEKASENLRQEKQLLQKSYSKRKWIFVAIILLLIFVIVYVSILPQIDKSGGYY